MSEPDTSDEIQAQIEEATNAGDHAKAAALYRQQQGTTDPYGLEPAPVPAVEIGVSGRGGGVEDSWDSLR